VLKDIQIKESEKRIKITCTEDQLSLAIGKRGQNARLASRLIGWQIDIGGEKVEILTFDDQVADAVTAITALPGISQELAQNLVNSGFHSANDLKQIEPGDLDGIPGLEEHTDVIIAAAQGDNAPEAAEEKEEQPVAAAEDESTEEPAATEESSPEELTVAAVSEAGETPPVDDEEQAAPEAEEQPATEEKASVEENPGDSKD
jgi:N utilization substance protein A